MTVFDELFYMESIHLLFVGNVSACLIIQSYGYEKTNLCSKVFVSHTIFLYSH